MLLNYLFAPNELVLTGDLVSHLQRLRLAKVRGDKSVKDECAIIICNHQSYADWIYVWLLAYYFGMDRHLRIILKASLSHVPIVGWGMRAFEFIFLQRRWQVDKANMKTTLERMNTDDDGGFWLLLFPEGTVICRQTHDRTVAYAKKVGITRVPRYVLLPRSTGLKFCLKELRPRVNAVYNLTVGYSNVDRHGSPLDTVTLKNMYARSSPPPQVHMHMERISIEDIDEYLVDTSNHNDDDDNGDRRRHLRTQTPDDALNARSVDTTVTPAIHESPFHNWVMDLFYDKDELMNKFYTTGHFGVQPELIIPVGQEQWLVPRSRGLTPQYALVKCWAIFFAIWFIVNTIIK